MQAPDHPDRREEDAPASNPPGGPGAAGAADAAAQPAPAPDEVAAWLEMGESILHHADDADLEDIDFRAIWGQPPGAE